MSDISGPALEKALAKVKQLVPDAAKVEVIVSDCPASTTMRRSLTKSLH